MWFDKHRMKTDFKWRLEKLDELESYLNTDDIYDKDVTNDTRRIL